MERRAFGGISCLLRSNWSFLRFDVCICTDASERGFAFFEGGPCLGTDKVREQFQVHWCQVECAPLHRTGCCFGGVQVRTRMRCRLPEGRDARTSQRSRCNFWIPRKWKLAACGGFSRDGNIIVLEARSILYGVRKTIPAKIITEMRGADLIVFRRKKGNDCKSMRFKFFRIKKRNGINSLAGHFLKLQTSFFLF